MAAFTHTRKYSLPRFTVMRRELAQLAAQRNTYILRTLYALVASLLGIIIYHGVADSVRRGWSFGYIYGHGSDLLEGVTIFALISIVAVLPAMVVGSVTSEREQGTLDLMRISRLSAWDIVIQKYVARIIPFCAFILLLIPLGAVAYGLGGVSVGDLIATSATLLSAILRVAAISLLCSALCTSTLSAFLTAYLSLLVLYAGVPMLWEAWMSQWDIFTYIDDDWITAWEVGPWMENSITLPETLGYLVQLCLGLLICLGGAKILLARSPRSRGAVVKQLHRRYDHFVEWLNRYAGNVQWGDGGATLPENKPIAWRERSRAAVCVPRHMFRLLCLVCVPTVLVLAMIVSDTYLRSNRGDVEALSYLLMFLWFPAVLVPAVYVANLISGERNDQTLDVLLTTPIQPREIIHQKMAGVSRVKLLVATPMIMTILVEFWVEYVRTGQLWDGFWYLVMALSSIGIYLSLVVWIAMSCSLRTRRRSVVVLRTFVWILIAIFVPILLALLCNALLYGDPFESENLLYISPVGVYGATEFSEIDSFEALASACFGLSVYFGIYRLLRHSCLYSASRLLHRAPRGN
jgi:ABC-type transport system involved in multi-copper enzyme maturation permease subunit